MRHWLFILVLAANQAFAAQGLLSKATDRELTVYFVAEAPNVSLRGNESIHPQLKPTFSGEFTGYLILTNAAEVTLTGAPQIFVDGKDVANRAQKFPAGQRKLRIPFKRASHEPFEISLRANGALVTPEALAYDKAPRDLGEHQSRDLGRKLFEDWSCGVCHDPATPIIRFAATTNAVAATALRALRPTQGCLAEEPEPNTPRFEFKASERAALQLFIQTPDISPAPMQDLPRLFEQMGCQKCHAAPSALDASKIESAIAAHREAGMLTNSVAADVARLIELFSRRVAGIDPKP